MPAAQRACAILEYPLLLALELNPVVSRGELQVERAPIFTTRIAAPRRAPARSSGVSLHPPAGGAAPLDLVNVLRAKAESAGRVVLEVNPAGTSQTCAQC